MPDVMPLGWRYNGACVTEDPELFFPFPTETGDVAEAVAVCNSCAVREQCLSFALDTAQGYGIWGGKTEEERREIVRGARRIAVAADLPELVHGTTVAAQWERRHNLKLCDICLRGEFERRLAARNGQAQLQMSGADHA